MNNPKLYWLRWIGVLPAAVVSYLLVFGLGNIVLSLTGSSIMDGDSGDKSIVSLLAPGLAAGIGAYAFIFVGTYLAPLYKRTTGLILLIIVSMAVGVGIFLLIIYGLKFRLILEIIGQAIGGFVGYKQIEENEID